MPVYCELENLDEAFSRSQGMIINDLPNKTEEDRESFLKLISNVYTSDKISLLPSCQCGEIRRESAVGILCPSCKTIVKSSLMDDIVPSLWFRSPVGVAPLLNPIILMMLLRRFDKRNFNIILWLTDRDYRAPSIPESIVSMMNNYGIQRGYNFFYENFDKIMNILFTHSEFKAGKKSSTSYFIDMLFDEPVSENLDLLYELIKKHRELMFSRHIPLPNSTLTILEKNALGSFSDYSVIEGRDAFNMMLSIDADYHDQRPTVKENRTAKILYKNSVYYEQIFSNHFKPKSGLFRKHIYGTRVNHSFRAVITTHEDIIYHDEIFIPWCVGIATLRLLLMNKLMDLARPDTAFTHNQAVELLMSHVNKYHPLLDKLFKEIIAESPYKGLPMTMLRNPTLKQGSIQVVYGTRIKTDAIDTTVSGHDILCGNNNGDYDGDEEMFTFTMDNRMTAMVYPLSPFFNLLDMDKPFNVGRTAIMRDPDVATISNWIDE